MTARSLPRAFHRDIVRIDLVGCGGSGSHMLSGLARLDTCLAAVGHPGLRVLAHDPDRVSPANLGRQMFLTGDVGGAKAEVLTNRTNAVYGVAWSASVARYADAPAGRTDIVVGCVDTAAARLEIEKAARARSAVYWIDLGNADSYGQVVWGELDRSEPGSLPTVLDLHPEIRDAADRPETGPSCSLAESLDRQSAFVNQAMATVALDAMWRAFRSGVIGKAAWYVNLEQGQTRSLSCADAAARAAP